MIVSASIVIYNEKKEILKKAIDSFLSIDLEKELIVVDNSPQDILREFCNSFIGVKYIYSGANLGFGKAHNLAFKSLERKSDVHIIINPDVYFNVHITELVLFVHKMDDISICVPKVFFPNETYQKTVREIPSIIRLFKRKLNIKSDEFQENILSKTKEIPFAHGCFLVFKTDTFKKLNGFDERFFMYMEDVDIFIRAKEYGKTVINPNFKIYHEYRKGSSFNVLLFIWHLRSAIKFFLKYPKFIF